MVASSIESEPLFQLGDQGFEQRQSNMLVRTFVKRYEHAVKPFGLMHLFASSLALFEILAFIIFFSSIYSSSYMPFFLGGFFLTIFASLLLKLYIQIKKTEKLPVIVDNYIEACRTAVRFQSAHPEHHLTVARYCKEASIALKGTDFTPDFLRSLKMPQILASLFRYICKEESFQIQEILLKKAIEEHLNLIRIEPTHLEVHAALANCYVHLSELYKRFIEEQEGKKYKAWLSDHPLTEKAEEKYKNAIGSAIEELDILRYYAPDDAWVHMQLAFCYRDLHLVEEEIKEWEIIMRITPEDREALYTLGKLYFQQGKNALGLRVYEELKIYNYKKASQLLENYGT